MHQVLHHEIHHHSEDSDWVVFVHGAGGSTRTWRRQIESFGEDFNLLMVDLRGHGNSTSDTLSEADAYSFELIGDDVVEVMDSLKIPSGHFIGVSLGSIIIRKIEQKHADRVDSIVLAGGIFGLDFKLKVLTIAAKGLSYVMGHRTLYKLFARIALPKENHKKSREIFIRESKKMAYEEFGLWINLYHELRPTLKDLFEKRTNAPTFVVMGNEDYLFLPSSKAYSKKFDNVWLEVVENCGHVVSIEKASEFNDLALGFLREQVATDPHNNQTKNIESSLQ